MITIVNIYESIVSMLKGKFPAYEIYGQELKEGFTKPSFLVSVIPKNISMESYHYKKVTYSVSITYYQNEFDLMDNMQKIEELQSSFGMSIPIGDRALKVSDYHFAYIGTNSNILQFTFELDYWIKNEIADVYEPMSDLSINEKLK